MKNMVLAFVFALLGTGLFAQEGFKIGIQGGLPIGDYDEKVSVVVGADVGYMWALGEVIDLGITTGFVHGFAETFHTETVLTDLPNMQFIPLAASLRLWPSNSFSLGGSVGQALGINEGNEGGLYYRPQVGFLMGPQTELNLSYTGINLDGDSWSTVTLGIVYTILSARHYR